jgi:hypothetical protein
MGEVKKNSTIVIKRSIGGQTDNLGNGLFNGYVYSMSLEVGFNGEPTSLTLNLALNKTLNQVATRTNVIAERKKDVARIKSLMANKKSISSGSVNSSGNTGNVGTPNRIASIVDKDFNIDEKYMGVECSYNIQIIDPDTNSASYNLQNFKIVSFSISKTNNQKILSLVLKDNSFVLSKIYVGILGTQIAMDSRSVKDAYISGVKINCAPNNQSLGGLVTLNNLLQPLHFVGSSLAEQMIKQGKIDTKTMEYFSENGSNYIVIKSKDPNKTIYNGYGAVILIGEEQFKDAPCASSEVDYSFDTLLKAMKTMGISIAKDATNKDSLVDKSNTRVRRTYSGNLKEVLNQWCDEYAYTYVVDFATESNTNFTIKGIDLSNPLTKETVLKTKLDFEDLESSSSNFVIKSQDFSYDMSQKHLKVFSSYYSKDSRNKDISLETNLGTVSLNCISLLTMFPQLFANSSRSGKDFAGTNRQYEQVVISSILGLYDSKLREIYNYSIGAYQALGFVPLGNNADQARLNINGGAIEGQNDLVFSEAINQVLDNQQELFFDDLGNPVMDATLGFFNADLANKVLEIENYIANFIGRHYWTDEIDFADGSSANANFSADYQVNTVPSTQKVLIGELYNLPIFQQGRLLINSIQSIFQGTDKYYNAFREFQALKVQADIICKTANDSYQKYISDYNKIKRYRFYHERTDAAYGSFKDFIDDLKILRYSVGNNSGSSGSSGSSGLNEVFDVDLSTAYAPSFKQLSPTSIGALQAVLPMDITNLPLPDYKFGILLAFNANNQIFSFGRGLVANTVNPIELENSIIRKCAIIAQITSVGNQRSKDLTKNSCSKTIYYSTCVLPAENQKIISDNSAKFNFESGPNPWNCFSLFVNRNNNWSNTHQQNYLRALIQANITKTLIVGQNYISLQPTLLDQVNVQTIRLPYKIPYESFVSQYPVFSEPIVLPSQASYNVKLVSNLNTSTYLPFLNLVLGGLEDGQDLQSILSNDAFSIDITSNNITPNLRELFIDQTQNEIVSANISIGQPNNDDPVVIDYKGYIDNNPNYEFKTFSQFHQALKAYYQNKSISLLEPNVKYSAEIFCNKITPSMKALFSPLSGLRKLNINLSENGLNISFDYESLPANPLKLETLITKSRPNIKLLNTNFFK